MQHISEERLVLYYYGEPEGAATEQHLADCNACRSAYQALQRVLNSVDGLPVPELPETYEADLWRKLGPHVSVRPRPRWTQWGLAAALAAALVAAFLAGRGSRPDQSALIRERVLLVAVGDHLERSRMVLVELANADPAQLDISFEQRSAEDLLEANRLYRQTAASTGDASTAGMLEDLERVLLEIAHSPETVSAPQLEDLKRHIEDRGILLKVKVFGSQLEQREVL